MVHLPKIFHDEKYTDWVDYNTDECIALKPNAPKELQEALKNYKKAVAQSRRVITNAKEWEELTSE